MTSEEQWLLREKYQGEKTEAFFADCDRLLAGEPLAYLIGHIPFLHCLISLDSHPLIPRTETEFWTEKATKHIQERGRLYPSLDSARKKRAAGGFGLGDAVLHDRPEWVGGLAVRHDHNINVGPIRVLSAGVLSQRQTAECGECTGNRTGLENGAAVYGWSESFFDQLIPPATETYGSDRSTVDR